MEWTLVPELKASSLVEAVGEFWISSSFVSVADYMDFCAATGYRTFAERAGNYRTIRVNPEMTEYQQIGQDLRYIPANYITLADAREFASHLGCFVATEAQYLSAKLQSMPLAERVALGFNSMQPPIAVYLNIACMCDSKNGPVGRWGPSVAIDNSGSIRKYENRTELEENWFSVDVSFAVTRSDSPT
jgi:hypothetical protein